MTQSDPSYTPRRPITTSINLKELKDMEGCHIDFKTSYVDLLKHAFWYEPYDLWLEINMALK